MNQRRRAERKRSSSHPRGVMNELAHDFVLNANGVQSGIGGAAHNVPHSKSYERRYRLEDQPNHQDGRDQLSLD